MSEEGKKKLKDLAGRVREKLDTSGKALLDARGLALIEEMAKELTGPDGLPGLRLFRDGAQRIKLQRERKNAEIVFEWQREIGAAVMTCTELAQVKRTERYVWDEAKQTWRRMSGAPGEPFDDIGEALVEVLYPEGR
jgi:hypothetical protein